MIEDWHPRADILELAHRWQVVFLLFLVGSLIGWGVGVLVPSPYRAESTFYVGFNADPVSRNPDDYKNWYLSQLEIYSISEGILEETLNQLRVREAYWSSVSLDDLKPRLKTYWRNAGRWRLVAEWGDSEHAFQLGQSWSAVFLDSVNQSISDAYTLIELDARTRSTTATLVDINHQELRLAQVKKALQTWQAGLSPTNNTLPLEPLERWRLLRLAATLVEFNPIELALVNQAPSSDAQAQAYAPWVTLLLTSAESQITALQGQANDINLQLEQLKESFQKNVQTSNGLTAYLVVEPLQETLPAQPVRRSSLMALVGGCVAVLAYALFWLARPLKKAAS